MTHDSRVRGPAGNRGERGQSGGIEGSSGARGEEVGVHPRPLPAVALRARCPVSPHSVTTGRGLGCVCTLRVLDLSPKLHGRADLVLQTLAPANPRGRGRWSCCHFSVEMGQYPPRRLDSPPPLSAMLSRFDWFSDLYQSPLSL